MTVCTVGAPWVTSGEKERGREQGHRTSWRPDLILLGTENVLHGDNVNCHRQLGWEPAERYKSIRGGRRAVINSMWCACYQLATKRPASRLCSSLAMPVRFCRWRPWSLRLSLVKRSLHLSLYLSLSLSFYCLLDRSEWT